MPSLGADMEFGTVVKWRVKPGDVVRRGDVVAEVETQKGVFEIDIRENAVIGELLVGEGTRVKVGATMARLEPTTVGLTPMAEPVTAMPPVGEAVEALAARPREIAPGEPAGEPAPGGDTARHRLRASPLARRVAGELGVDLARVEGTGEAGVITKADVERAATASAKQAGEAAAATAGQPPTAVSGPARARVAAPSGMRDAIAAAMARSKREIPHYYLSEEIELGRAMAWLRDVNATRALPNRILPAALLLHGVARALSKFPEFNGHYVDGVFHPSDRVHLGVAVSLRGGGLVAPAIHDADRIALDDLMQRLADVVRRARKGGLRASEITDPTITVTNLGDEGVRSVHGIIIPPQVAIIGFGAIGERPWAEDGLIGVRPVVTATLSADHRVSDGWRGARFLGELRRVFAEPGAP
jgi:pyruvate dehydrogenase E2 component (dihydrolipoamide acetyltransferase)